MENKNSDKLLWKQLKQGSVDALSSLYDMYADELYLYGLKVTTKDDIVKDCIHDLFLDLYKYKANLADDANVKFYLLRSLKNKILKNPEYRSINQELESTMYMVPVSSVEDDMIAYEMADENSRKLANALQLLTKTQREGILLKYVHNKSYEEIATIMDIKIETSRTIIYRAVKSLKELVLMMVFFFFYN